MEQGVSKPELAWRKSHWTVFWLREAGKVTSYRVLSDEEVAWLKAKIASGAEPLLDPFRSGAPPYGFPLEKAQVIFRYGKVTLIREVTHDKVSKPATSGGEASSPSGDSPRGQDSPLHGRPVRVFARAAPNGTGDVPRDSGDDREPLGCTWQGPAAINSTTDEGEG